MVCLISVDVGVAFERLDVEVAVVGVFQLRGLMRIIDIDGSESIDLDANRYEQDDNGRGKGDDGDGA